MTKIRATNGAGKAFYANHLAANDYYSEKEKVVGIWKGKLSACFGLDGCEVTTEDFSLFQRNIDPYFRKKLTQRTVMTGVRFFDFQCAAPKSVSIMSLWDERLVELHRKAVDEAMTELEKLAAVRVRTGDNVRTHNIEMTGKIIYASFQHDASRALDPQLHTHNVVVNVTRDSDRKYKALETLEMCRAIRYAGKVYHNSLCNGLLELGYKLVEHRDEKGNIIWKDIAGVSQEIMDVFSKRRHQIEEMAAEFIAEHGRKPTLEENNFLSVTTRDRKMLNADKESVRGYQLAQLTEEQKASLTDVWRHAYKKYCDQVDPEGCRQALKKAVAMIYERESVVKMDKVLAETLNQSLGLNSLEIVKHLAAQMPELQKLGGLKSNPWVSPKEVIERELYAVNSVEEQRNLFEPIAPDFVAFPGEKSRKKQAELIHGMLSSKDRFNLFRGVAGAGKTSTLQELCKGLRSGGVNSIYVIAPTNSATDVLKQEGFEASQTVAHFLVSPQKPPKGSYVIIDESGLNSLREGVEILKTARQNNYRVLFVGDARQHTAVESGDFFRLLEDHSKIQKFSLTEIHRQQNEEYRRGIAECALGNFDAAFARFDKNGFIREGKSNYLQDAAESYMNFTDDGKFIDRSILVAPTHAEGDRLTGVLREKLKQKEAIAPSGQTMQVFRSWRKPKSWLSMPENYTPGSVVAFIRNMNGVGSAGETAVIERNENGLLYLSSGKTLHAKHAADFVDIGEMQTIELCKGDLIQFNVNLRDRKIYNGNIAQVTDIPGKVMLLHADGTPRKLIDLPADYKTLQYGWVTTSHKAQGRTSETVVVAAQSLDRKAFYVALSRGRKQMALHCPDKIHLKQQLKSRTGDRTAIHDLAASGEISPDILIPLSADALKRKRVLWPDFSYKEIAERAKKFVNQLKRIAKQLAGFSKRIKLRRSRAAKYGYGPVPEKIRLEIRAQNAADELERERAAAARKARFKSIFAPSRSLSPYEQALHDLAEDKRLSQFNEPSPKQKSLYDEGIDFLNSLPEPEEPPKPEEIATPETAAVELEQTEAFIEPPPKQKSLYDEGIDFLNSLPEPEDPPKPEEIASPETSAVEPEQTESFTEPPPKQKSLYDEGIDFLNSLPEPEEISKNVVPEENPKQEASMKTAAAKADFGSSSKDVFEDLFSLDSREKFSEEINRRYAAKMEAKQKLAAERAKQEAMEQAEQKPMQTENTLENRVEPVIVPEAVELPAPEPKIEKKKPSRGMDI